MTIDNTPHDASTCDVCIDRANTAASRNKRTSAYVMPPKHFEIAACDCGNVDTQWSEFESMIWCANCEKDFLPSHWGVLDGPVAVNASILIGMNFDRYSVATGRIRRQFAKERKKLGLAPTKYKRETGPTQEGK